MTSSSRQGHSVLNELRESVPDASVEFDGSQPAFADTSNKSRHELLLVDPNGERNPSSLQPSDHGHHPPALAPSTMVGTHTREHAFLEMECSAVEVLREFEVRRMPSAKEHAVSHSRHLQSRPESISGALMHVPGTADALRENQKMATLGRLTASIAHEINNPLESVSNLLFLIGSDLTLSRETQNYLQIAQQELARIVRISTQTLTFSRESPAPIKTDLSHLLEEVLVLYARRIAAKQLEVIKEYDAETPISVFPGEIRQVFSNLITNAIEASHRGGKLRLRTHAALDWTDGAVRGIRVSIADNGCGIAPHIRTRLGEPFFTTKGERGTGLGLWVTQSILERYQGNLHLRSNVGEKQHGTVFSVFLPDSRRPKVAASARPAHEQEEFREA